MWWKALRLFGEAGPGDWILITLAAPPRVEDLVGYHLLCRTRAKRGEAAQTARLDGFLEIKGWDVCQIARHKSVSVCGDCVVRISSTRARARSCRARRGVHVSSNSAVRGDRGANLPNILRESPIFETPESRYNRSPRPAALPRADGSPTHRLFLRCDLNLPTTLEVYCLGCPLVVGRAHA